MSVATCLVVYGFAVSVLGPPLLVRLTRAGVAPRLGVGAWLAVMGSVVGSWAAAGAFLLGELARDWKAPTQILGSCWAGLRSLALGGHGVAVQVGLLMLTTVAMVAAAVLGVSLLRSLLRARMSTHQHARMARLVGRPLTRPQVVVLKAPQRLAYCVAGRPPAIVVTSAALDALEDRHLAAVVSHERAHLAGHHHLLLALTRALATTLSKVRLFTTGAAEVAGLLEMCADDAAARTHGPGAVLEALLRLANGAPLPTGALGASGVGVLARAHRLATPPRPVLRWRVRLLLATITAVVLTGPVLTALLAAHGLAFCGSLG
jgi:Zn-dependent protease with chaperone function